VLELLHQLSLGLLEPAVVVAAGIEGFLATEQPIRPDSLVLDVVPLPSPRGIRLWISPLPKVWLPSRALRPSSCRAPATISLALAVPPLTRVSIGPSYRRIGPATTGEPMPSRPAVSTIGSPASS
jgi:hypothetical protein